MSRGDGFVLLSKPAGLTSFEALGTIKRRLGSGKVGHAGTLDRFAEGLLIVLCGALTRLARLASDGDKEYEAVVRLGAETDTLDPEGRVIAEGPMPSRLQIEAAIPAFIGAIRQVPPAFSAIHVGGRRAYQAARAGETVELAEREVTIHGLELLDFTPPDLSIRVRCSKGTYVRSLARDLARSCGSVGHLVRLVRTRIAGFRLEEAVTPDQFQPERDLRSYRQLFDRIQGVEEILVKPDSERPVRAGRPLTSADFASAAQHGRYFALFGQGDTFLALASRADSGEFRYEFVAPGLERN